MSFGLCNAPTAFQKAILYVFLNLLHKLMKVFINEYSTRSSKRTHYNCIRLSLQRYTKAKIALNLNKIFLVIK